MRGRGGGNSPQACSVGKPDYGICPTRGSTVRYTGPRPVWPKRMFVQFRNDIYNRDARLIARLRQPASGNGQQPAPVAKNRLLANNPLRH